MCAKNKADVSFMQKPSSDDEFLASRLIFFTTYGTKADFNDLFDKHGLASNVNKVGGYLTSWSSDMVLMLILSANSISNDIPRTYAKVLPIFLRASRT